MRCALVNLTTNVVENVVEVMPGDASTVPAGYKLVASNIGDIGMVWDSVTNSFPLVVCNKVAFDPSVPGAKLSTKVVATPETAPIAAFLATLPATKP